MGPGRAARFRTWLAATALAAAIVVAYANSLGGPFVFDDLFAIRDNPTIRRLWPLAEVLVPPAAHGETVGGRPLVNLTLALDYAVHGLRVHGYHAVNLALHLAAALALFGLIRRTLGPPRDARGGLAATAPPGGIFPSGLARHRDAIAALAAALWALHPLQTESVTYVVQRAEALAGGLSLFTLYAVRRAADAQAEEARGGCRRWTALAVASCALGMTAKETMVTTPILALLYDRTFLAGTFRAAWRARRPLYLGLAASWVILLALVIPNAQRGGSAGFGLANVSSGQYLLAQPAAIDRYLRLLVWPEGLTFDYGPFVPTTWARAFPHGVIVVALLTAAGVALRRRPALGFAAAWFLLALAPSSSVVPIATQAIAEHRTYLAIAAVVAGAVVAALWIVGRRAWPALATAAIALVALTAARNRVYRTTVGLWHDTTLKQPANARAEANLGAALADAGQFDAAITHDRRALTLQPDSAEAENNLGTALAASGRAAEASSHFEAALRLRPEYADAHYNYAKHLAALRRLPDAIAHYAAAISLDPDFVAAHGNLGRALAQVGRVDAAEREYRRALELDADYVPARVNLGNLLVRTGRPGEALPHYRRVLQVQPRLLPARLGYAEALAATGRAADALDQLFRAVQLAPDDPDAHAALADALGEAGRGAEAAAQAEIAATLRRSAASSGAPSARTRNR